MRRVTRSGFDRKKGIRTPVCGALSTSRMPEPGQGVRPPKRRQLHRDTAAREMVRAGTGRMFWFSRKKLFGSYFRFSSAKRAYFSGPKAAASRYAQYDFPESPA